MHKQQQRSKAQESTARIAQSAKKLIGGIFSTMSVAHADDDEDDCCSSSSTTTSACRADRLLSNGDFYTGEWADGTPHGTGKYLWTDGCMYEGEWASGEITGHGKFSWPSGATYEGQFSSGFMHGLGTYTGPAGDTYRGSWALNSKHGEGRKNYANGDCYEGEWRCGSQDGRGRYVWKNGNEYEGEWKNGGICGKGSMLWANGNRYVGSWEDGLPKGEGRFMWADGSFHVGNWSMYQNEQSGTYYPSVGSSAFGMLDREPHEVFSIDLDTVTVCPVEKVSILPSEKTLSCDRMWLRTRTNDNCKNACRLPEKGFDRICIWETNGDITCDIVVGSSVAEQDGKDEFIDLRVDNGGNSRRPPTWQVKEIKKQGETISKGHKNYELMLSLQLGIRYSVGKPAPATSLDLKLSAFNPKEKAWTKFPPEGTKYTPPHQTSEFKWKDYCPLVFRTLRKVFKIDAADYMISICGNDVLRELSSPGKSGSLFYLTHDDHFMIKTLKKSEVKVLLRMLPAYYNHVRAFENTLVTKFFGLHCVKLSGTAQKKVFFVIMGNLCCSEYAIHRRFDLKGSSHGRVTVKPEAEIDENTTLKDLDLNCIFRLPKAWFEELHRQLDRDCDFLEQERIMDYSLLVGMHFREASFSLDSSTIEGNCKLEQASGASPRLSSVDMHQILFEPTRWATIRLGENMPARIEQTIRRSNCDSQMIGQPTGKFCDALLFFGIIDILQDYDISKKLEHAYKSIHYDPTSISAVDPKQYSKRFHDFIYKVFVEDT